MPDEHRCSTRYRSRAPRARTPRAGALPVLSTLTVTLRLLWRGRSVLAWLTLPALGLPLLLGPTGYLEVDSWSSFAALASALAALTFARAAVVRYAVDAFGDREPSLWEVWAATGRRGVSLLLTSGLAALLTLVGILAALVPGFFACVALAVALPVAVVEGHRGVSALRRSLVLTRGRRWAIAALVVVSLVVGMVLMPRLELSVSPDRSGHLRLLVYLPFALRTAGFGAFVAFVSVLQAAVYARLGEVPGGASPLEFAPEHNVSPFLCRTPQVKPYPAGTLSRAIPADPGEPAVPAAPSGVSEDGSHRRSDSSASSSAAVVRSLSVP